MKKTLICIFTLLIPLFMNGQSGGDNTYEFLNLPVNSLVTTLGGMNVSLQVTDPGLAACNPSLLTGDSNGIIALNYVNYLAGINYGYASYSLSKGDLGDFSAGVTYLNYGKFTGADPTGYIYGTFTASEVALNLIWSYSIDSLFRVGVNLKPVFSSLEKYNSTGLVFDIGGSYRSRNGLLTAGISLRNTGLQITTYTGIREKTPIELVAGISTRLAHAPFRFSVTARNLQRYNLIHEYIEDINNPDRYTGISGITENIMRHFVVGAEFLPTENFFVATGFNYQRRKELQIENQPSTVGFSLGCGIKLSSFELTIGRSKYHLAGSSTTFSLIVKPAAFNRRN